MIHKKLAVTIMMAVCSAAVMAISQFDVQFVADANNSKPMEVVAVAGTVNTHPTYVKSAANAEVTVDGSFTDSWTGASVGSGKVAVMADNSGTDAPALYFDGADTESTASGKVLVSFDMLVDYGFVPTGNCFITFQNKASGNLAQMWVQMGLGRVVVDGNDIGSFIVGLPQHVAAILDLDLRTIQISIDGSLLATKPLSSPPSGSEFDKLTIGTSNPAYGEVAVDNILIKTLPNNCAQVVQSGMTLAGDVNGDCYVNINDIALLATNWLKCSNVQGCN